MLKWRLVDSYSVLIEHQADWRIKRARWRRVTCVLEHRLAATEATFLEQRRCFVLPPPGWLQEHRARRRCAHARKDNHDCGLFCSDSLLTYLLPSFSVCMCVCVCLCLTEAHRFRKIICKLPVYANRIITFLSGHGYLLNVQRFVRN